MELYTQNRVIYILEEVFFSHFKIVILWYHFNYRLVDDDCYPYVGESGRCKVHRTDTLSSVSTYKLN